MTKIVRVMPDMRVVHPDFGDMTEDVARELQAMERENEERIFLEAQKRQNRIAGAVREAPIGHNGLRLVAQIDETVFSYWEAREGREFWKHEMKYMMKRHPELAVKNFNPNPVFGDLGGQRQGVRGKRGRWAA